ncbi:MAG: PAS domain S-box protein [Candidatus Latescibacteria bacterium]|nr:PAS domain S-box protein [Candidatus Latescibacterota bacterium]
MDDKPTREELMEEIKRLREKARQFDTLVDNLNGMVYRCKNDEDWTMEYVSGGSKLLTGYDPEDFIGNGAISINKLIHKDDCEMVYNTIRTAVKEHSSYALIYRIISAEGKEKWLWEQGYTVICEGEVKTLEGFITDITVMKQAEEALKKSEERYRLLADNTLDAIWKMDMNGRFTYVNSAIKTMFGYTPEEWIGSLLSDHCDEEYMERMKDIMTHHLEHLNKHRGIIFETVMRRRDGSPISVEVHSTSLLNDEGKPVGFHGTTRDITERKRTRKDLFDSEQRFRALIENLPDSVFVLDLDGKLLIVNQASCLHTGFSQDELLNFSVNDIDPESADRHDRQKIWLSLKTGDTAKVQSHILRKDGSHYPAEIHMNRLVMNERPIILAVVRDVSERQKNEEALRKSEEYLKERNIFIETILDNLPIGLAVNSTLDGSVIYMNKQFANIYGWPREKVDSVQHFFELVYPDPDYRQEIMSRVLDDINSGDPKRMIWNDIKITTQEKTNKYVTAMNIPLPDQNVMISTVQDVTDRKFAEDALRKSEKLLNEVQKLTKVGGWEYNVPDQKIFWTEEVYNIHGFSKGENELDSKQLIDKSIECYDPNDRLKIVNAFTRCVNEGIPYDLEVKFSSNRGERKWVRTTAYAQKENDTIVKIIGNLIDITDQKLATEALSESERKYRSLFDNMLNGFALHEIVLDQNGKPVDFIFREVNNAYRRMTGISTKNILGKTVTEVFPGIENDPAGWIPLYAEVALNDKEIRFEQYAEPLDKWYSILAYSPKKGFFATVVEDITERKHAEEERIQLEEKLRQSLKLESIGQLAGGVAHDFNNLLTIITGNCELILMELNSRDSIYDDVTEIKTTAERATQITRQLLTFSRKQIISPKVLNLNKIINAQQKMLSRLIGEDIRFIFDLADGLWNIKIDPSQLDQILVNFSVNARDAIEGVGTIKIETRNVSLDETFDEKNVNTSPGEYVMLAYSDSGVGMDAETRDKAFEPFFSTKSESKGTGLGLSTVYGIVKQNDGIINVYSEPGIGTTFKVYFPRFMGEHEGIVEKMQGIPLKGNETVLIVEDEPHILSLAQKVLSRYGYSVLACNTTDEAIKLVNDYTGEIHLLLTDVVMPVMNGKELQTLIQPIKPGIKTIFMSGYTADVIAHHGVIDKGVEFIQKPFNMITLAEKVREVLDRNTDDK